MILNERQETILEYLNEHSHASVHELALRFFVSEMTIRRDLKAMEAEGYLQRYNGGATKRPQNEILPFATRKLFHAENKSQIETAISPYLEDNISIFIDSSSTCFYILPVLKGYHHVHVITNSLSACFLAAEYHIPCTVIGGELCARDLCSVGSDAIMSLEKLNVDVAFFSSQAISSDGRITDNDHDQTAVRQVVLSNCSKSIVLLDESKRDKICLYTFAHVSEVDEVIFITESV